MNFQNDIPFQVAMNAHAGTSFVPEERAKSEIKNYTDVMDADFAQLQAEASTNEKRAILAVEFERYHLGYRRRYLELLQSQNGLVSTMIAGPSKFPVGRMQKKNEAIHRRMVELVEYRAAAKTAIMRKLHPENAPIMAGDGDAVERLAHKLSQSEMLQARMKIINAAHKAFLKNPASLDASALTDADKNTVRTYKPPHTWQPHPFAPFELTNLGANIRRLRARLEHLQEAKQIVTKEIQGAAARIEDAPADNRVRLFFPGKPAPEVRDRLKSSGFRWTPSLGCWQAYRNSRSLQLAPEIAGITKQEA